MRVSAVLWPTLSPFLLKYPDITVELVIDDVLTDMIEGRFDAGVRLGEEVAKDMVAAPISPTLRMAAVAAPSYFASRARPGKPQDLTAHTCINRRMATYGGLSVWGVPEGRPGRAGEGGRPASVQRRRHAIAGRIGRLYIAFLLEDQVRLHVTEGRLEAVEEVAGQ